VACRVRGSEQSQLINIPWNGRRVTIVVSMDPVEEITRVGQSKGIKRRNNAVGFRSGGPKSIFFFAHAKLGAYRNDFSCNCVKTTVVLFHLTCYHVRKSKDLNV